MPLPRFKKRIAMDETEKIKITKIGKPKNYKPTKIASAVDDNYAENTNDGHGKLSII